MHLRENVHILEDTLQKNIANVLVPSGDAAATVRAGQQDAMGHDPSHRQRLLLSYQVGGVLAYFTNIYLYLEFIDSTGSNYLMFTHKSVVLRN